jgi:histidine ammonia-lyase
MDTIFLDGAQLTIDQVIAVAYGAPGAPEIRLTADASQRVTRAAQAVQQLIDDGVVAYGITTGFGAFKDRIIPAADVAQLQRNIVMSHAVGVGAPLDRATTRAILLIRANTLARGHSGVRLATLELLLELLNRGVHPVIPQKGSLGASGDLAPLAHMALVLIGLGEAEVDGAVMIRRRGAGRQRADASDAGRQRGAGAHQRHGRDGGAGHTRSVAGAGAEPGRRHRRQPEPGGAARHATGF